MIIAVNESNIAVAGQVHSESWKESHRGFCSAEFVEKHTPEAQTAYLRREMDAGKRVYLLVKEYPVGIVSVWGNLIENLYVLPREQSRGYGSRLLRFAMEQCDGVPTLWILSNNAGARRFYLRHGFRETGKRKQLNDSLYEVEMAWDRLGQIRAAEAASHVEAYNTNALYTPGSWLAKPVKTVLDILPLFEGREDLRALDLGCGVGRNSIPAARVFRRVDCVDILDLAIEKLGENAAQYGVGARIKGTVSTIDEYAIERGTYDLIMAISALEHVASEAVFARKLAEIAAGVREKGVVILVVNSGVRERDKQTGAALEPQFEVNFDTEVLQKLLYSAFSGWEILKETVVHQRYDIPRERGTAELETDVVTWAARRSL